VHLVGFCCITYTRIHVLLVSTVFKRKTTYSLWLVISALDATGK